MITIFFVMLNKNINSFNSIINYFIIQESLGIFFLIFTISNLQIVVLLIKIGVAPFHFWVFTVINDLFNFNLL